MALMVSLPLAGRAAPCTPPPALASGGHGTPAQALALGRWYGEHRQYDCAVQVLRSAQESAAGNPTQNLAPVLYLLALNLYAGGHPDQAVTPLQSSISAAPKAVPSHLLLAEVEASLGHPDDAVSELKAALAIDPLSVPALDGLARIRTDQGDAAGAIALLEASPRPRVLGSASLALDLARAYGEAGRLDQAETTLTEALRVQPSSAGSEDRLRLVDGLETILVLETRYQAAADLAAKYARLYPRSEQAQRLYLRALVLNHDTAAARPLARRLLAASPHDFDFLYLSGILEREAGEYPAARDHLTEAVALQPEQPSARFHLGSTLAALGDPAGARAQLEKALTLGSLDPQVRFALASALRALGDNEGAKRELALYQQQLHEQTARTAAASKSAQAQQAMAADDPVRAAALDREALISTPQDAQLSYRLSLALAKAGDTAGEKAALEQTVAIDPTFAIAEYRLGELAAEAGDAPSAERHLRAALASAPAYAPAWVSLAAVLEREQRPQEAQEAVANALRLDPETPGARPLAEALHAKHP